MYSAFPAEAHSGEGNIPTREGERREFFLAHPVGASVLLCPTSEGSLLSLYQFSIPGNSAHAVGGEEAGE